MPNLLLHQGDNRVERSDVKSAHTPSSTRTWQPIAHDKLLETVEDSLSRKGFFITNESHGLSHNGDRYFGLLEIRSGDEHQDYRSVVGVRNSHDKRFPAHVVAYWMNHSTRIAQKHYLQVTDDHYHRATSYEVSPPTVAWSSEKNFVGAQVRATSHVLASQGSTPALVANRPPLENSAFRDSDRQATTRKMPQVGDEGLELWCSKAFIYRSNVRAGHFSGGAGGGAHAT